VIDVVVDVVFLWPVVARHERSVIADVVIFDRDIADVVATVDDIDRDKSDGIDVDIDGDFVAISGIDVGLLIDIAVCIEPGVDCNVDDVVRLRCSPRNAIVAYVGAVVESDVDITVVGPTTST
jgi:hypothetical protein